jgi:hypothetical protein
MMNAPLYTLSKITESVFQEMKIRSSETFLILPVPDPTYGPQVASSLRLLSI